MTGVLICQVNMPGPTQFDVKTSDQTCQVAVLGACQCLMPMWEVVVLPALTSHLSRQPIGASCPAHTPISYHYRLQHTWQCCQQARHLVFDQQGAIWTILG